jgi:hypothetical protein
MASEPSEIGAEKSDKGISPKNRKGALANIETRVQNFAPSLSRAQNRHSARSLSDDR